MTFWLAAYAEVAPDNPAWKEGFEPLCDLRFFMGDLILRGGGTRRTIDSSRRVYVVALDANNFVMMLLTLRPSCVKCGIYC